MDDRRDEKTNKLIEHLFKGWGEQAGEKWKFSINHLLIKILLRLISRNIHRVETKIHVVSGVETLLSFLDAINHLVRVVVN